MSLTRQPSEDAYTPWTPPTFDDDSPRPEKRPEERSPATEEDEASQESAPDAPPSDTPAGPSPEEIEAVFAQARADGHARGVEQGREQGHEEGYRSGYEAGHQSGWEAGYQEASRQVRQLRQLVEAMDRSLDTLDEDVARELVSLASALAREMVRHTLATHPEMVANTAREALQHIPQGKVQVHLHPDDLALVREHLKDQLESGHHRLVADDAVTRGGCQLVSASTDVDATVESRWQRVLLSIGQHWPAWHDGADTPPGQEDRDA